MQANVRDAMPPPMHAADPFMTLAEQELSAGMSYIRDVASLNRARAERFKNFQGTQQQEEKPEKPHHAAKAKDKGGKPANKGGKEEGA